MKDISQIFRLVVTTLLLIVPPILLIVYGKKYATLTWDSVITHGIFMLFGFCSFLGTAVSSFKNLPIKSRMTRKLIHVLLHTCCLVFMFIGWAQIHKITEKSHGGHGGHGDDSHDHGSEDHYLSVHSWLGVLTMTVFCLTYLFSAVLFNPYLKFIKPSIRMAAKPFHISSGIGVTVLAAAATTTGLYNYIEKYVPNVFKSSQTPALRLILSAALFVGIAFFVLMFSLGVIHPNQTGKPKVNQTQLKEVMVNETVVNS
ncbi:lysosomal membrane ascorbate-dependent ferrireductase CYB561A3-like [Bolinopsis microptera]|uniref:lysosomal membrane ascorbate-dependent ferrireductase CYB561A3-like n=1 Tax=Bolinopsis microptera TaxID=2820187 RepID=UPI003078ED07